MAIGIWLPGLAVRADARVRRRLPPTYWPLLAATLVAYLVVTQAVKVWLLEQALDLACSAGSC